MDVLSRRRLLVAGGASALVAGIGAPLAYHSAPLTLARAPWDDAQSAFEDPRLGALAYAILAPNPHNLQPWSFQLVGGDTVDVLCARADRLPETDPFDRQITIGFGCLIELFRLAAEALGYRTEITPFPDGPGGDRLSLGRVARLRLIADNSLTPDPLFAHALTRRSNKAPFEDRAVSTDLVLALTSTPGCAFPASGAVDAETVAGLRDLTWQAWMAEYAHEATRKESIDLMRIGNRAINRTPDGIDLGGAAMGAMNMVGLVTHRALNSPGSTAYASGIDMYDRIINTAAGYVWLTTPGNSRRQQLQAGADWLRLNLAATSLGLAFHPLSQILQEADIFSALKKQVYARLGAKDGETVQMLVRLGFAAREAPAPRWPLRAKLIDAPA
ncbi:MAG: twin-arginine translocation pathway signal protein [Pseudomonadota bacterium]